jgi:rhodanese-related sulfurtransferase
MTQKSLFQQLVDDAKTRIREVTVQDFMAHPDESRPVLVDVREESDWGGGHAEGAIHLSRGVLELKIENILPDLNTPVVCYCGGGSRSALAADSLQKMGYKNVASLTGGFKAWQASGKPVTKDS